MSGSQQTQPDIDSWSLDGNLKPHLNGAGATETAKNAKE